MCSNNSAHFGCMGNGFAARLHYSQVVTKWMLEALSRMHCSLLPPLQRGVFFRIRTNATLTDRKSIEQLCAGGHGQLIRSVLVSSSCRWRHGSSYRPVFALCAAPPPICALLSNDVVEIVFRCLRPSRSAGNPCRSRGPFNTRDPSLW